MGLAVALQYRHADIKVMRRKVSVSHRHLKRLMTEPHLDPPYIYPASNKPGCAGMSQYVRDNVIVVSKAHLRFCLVPDDAETLLIRIGERPDNLMLLHLYCLGGAHRQRDRSATA